MALGNKVQFAYVTTGSSMPEYPDPDTIYFLEENKQIRVGHVLIADHGLDVSDLEAVLDAYQVKNIQITGSGNTISDISFDSQTGRITVVKDNLPVLSKGTTPTPSVVELESGAEFEVVTSTSVGGHTITDQKTKYKLPESSVYLAGQGINIDSGVISLPKAFYDYLVEQTSINPSIDTFTLTGLGSDAEIGSSVFITNFVHKETAIGNISGNLVLKHGQDVIKNDILPSSVSTTVSLSSSMEVTRRSAGTEIFSLSGTTSLGGTISKSVSKTFYVPKFTGAASSSTVTSSDVLGMSKGQTLPTSVTFTGGDKYIYFVTDETLSIVKDANTGFQIPIEDPVSLVVEVNSVSVAYHVYRTSESINAGTYNFTFV